MALSTSGKKVSERHDIAKSSGKLTAGEAVKLFKKAKITVKAKDLVSIFRAVKGRDPEWHHSGFYKASGKSTMGKTYFFTSEQIEEMILKWADYQKIIDSKSKDAEKQMNTEIYGFYYYWDFNYGGKYGKKQNFKVLGFYNGNEKAKPSNFTSLTKSEYEKHKNLAGKKYYGWDEPKKSEFA